MSKRKDVENVYCQVCGRELTYEGGLIINSGAILCNERTSDKVDCLEAYSLQNGLVIPIPYGSRGVQRQIRKERLKYYGPLEERARNEGC